MRHYDLLPISLTLFDGGAAPAAGGAGTGAGEGTAAPEVAAESTTEAPEGRNRRGRKGEQPVVVYGKQPDAGAAEAEPAVSDTVTSDTREAKRAEFERLIQGEYKELFTERTQGIINRRFKQTQQLEAQAEKTAPILELLGQKYNLKDASPEAIMAAIERDDSYWEDAADEAGLTVDQYKYMKKLERENESMQLFRQRQESEQRANEAYQAWLNEANAVKAEYPNFDLATEVRGNKQFGDLLRAGVSVKTAYEVCHVDDIKRTVSQKAAQSTAQNIRNKASRPRENGAAARNGVIFKQDVSKLTRADRAAAVRAAQRGEHIEW